MPDSTFYRMEEVGHRNRGWGHPRYKSVASHRCAMSRLSLELEVPRRKVNCACVATPLTGLIKPKVAIPCHYDMFPHNDTDPQLFRAALKFKAPDARFQLCRHRQMENQWSCEPPPADRREQARNTHLGAMTVTASIGKEACVESGQDKPV